MKRLFVVFAVLVVLVFSSMLTYAGGPWADPVPPDEPKSVQPPVIIMSSPWSNPVPPEETKSVQPINFN